MPVYDGDTQKWDHSLVIGDTYQPGTVQLHNAGVAYDITGATGVARLRRELGGEVLLSATVSLVEAADGTFTWSAAAAATAALEPGIYLYGVRLTFATGEVRTVLEGQVKARLTAAG